MRRKQCAIAMTLDFNKPIVDRVAPTHLTLPHIVSSLNRVPTARKPRRESKLLVRHIERLVPCRLKMAAVAGLVRQQASRRFGSIPKAVGPGVHAVYVDTPRTRVRGRVV